MDITFQKGEIMFTKNESGIFQSAGEGVTRKILSWSENMMIVEMEFKKGATGALHRHIHEQIGYVVKGKLELTDEGEKTVLIEGDSYYMAPGEEHGVKALEETKLIDVFTPMRQDFLFTL